MNQYEHYTITILRYYNLTKAEGLVFRNHDELGLGQDLVSTLSFTQINFPYVIMNKPILRQFTLVTYQLSVLWQLDRF